MILFLNAFSQLAHHFFLVNLRAFERFLPGYMSSLHPDFFFVKKAIPDQSTTPSKSKY
jgi:hypothetical protein